MKTMRQSNQSWFYFALLTIMVVVAFNSVSSAEVKNVPQVPEVKNIIVLVPDGVGSTGATLARWYKGSPLALDEMVVGGIRTYCANSIITDSAPAATAFATGYKSDSKFISVLPSEITVPAPVQVADADKFRPVATVLEGAKLLGKSTGMIATSNIQHATPACYSSHWPNRNEYNEIAEQQVYEGIDLVLGGGKQYLLPADKGGKRDDGENLIDVLKSRGYDFVENTDQMNKSTAKKIWGMFADDAMAYDFDRDPAKEPSLAEMTQKAIHVLSGNKKGFFLFVEGSKVDWADHANDPVGTVSDMLAFDKAVKVALDYAKKDKHTLVLVFADHNTGGMTIGNTQTNPNYDTLQLGSLINPLKKATLTGEGLEKKFNADKSNIAEVMSTYYGITDLTPDEITAIKNTKTGSMNYTVGPMISKRACIGWTTTGHVGEDLFLYAYGPQKPAGLIDNTDIAKLIAKASGYSLDNISKKEFVNVTLTDYNWGVRRNYRNMGFANPFILVSKGDITAELQASTNIMYIKDKMYQLNGVSLIINGVPYVPQQALDILKAAK